VIADRDLVDDLSAWWKEAQREAAAWLDRAESRGEPVRRAFRISDGLGRAVTVEDLFEYAKDEKEHAELLALVTRATVEVIPLAEE
jgi:hypothetical protein